MRGIEIKELDYFEDERGWLLKVIKREDLDKSDFGEVYITATKPGITRAEHYHKKTTEWFCVIKGKAILVLQDINTMERKEIIMEDGKFIIVKIPSGIVHAIKNIGEDTMYLVAVADKPYDPENTDTYSFNLTI